MRQPETRWEMVIDWLGLNTQIKLSLKLNPPFEDQLCEPLLCLFFWIGFCTLHPYLVPGWAVQVGPHIWSSHTELIIPSLTVPILSLEVTFIEKILLLSPFAWMTSIWSPNLISDIMPTTPRQALLLHSSHTLKVAFRALSTVCNNTFIHSGNSLIVHLPVGRSWEQMFCLFCSAIDPRHQA